MMVTGDSDVLIIGVGPAGAAAGIVLQHAGFRVCAVDAARFPRDKVCGDAVSNHGMRLIDMLGAGEAVRSGPHACVERACAILPDGTRIEREYAETGYIVPRIHLDACLRDRLEASGARVIEGCRVAELSQHAGRVVGAVGPSLRWTARLVIASNGYKSVGYRSLDIEAPRGRQLAVAVTAYYRDVSFPHGRHTADHWLEHEIPYGYAWVFPEVNGLSSVGVYMRSDAYHATGQRLNALMNDFIARHPERFARARRVSPLRSWPLPLAPRRNRISAPGVILAGDAASFIDPLSGEGIWQALYSGISAATFVAEALRSGGELTERLQRNYARACAGSIGTPSRRKAWAQQLIQHVIERRLYNNAALRWALRWGYQHQWLESSKL